MGALQSWLTGRSRGVRLAVAAGAVAAVAAGGYRVYRQAAAGVHFREATAAAARDDQPAARRHLAACLDEWPDSGEVLFLAARAARRDGDYPAAARFLKRCEAAGWAADAVEMERTLLAAQTGDFRRTEARILGWAKLNTDDQPLFLEVLVPEYLRRHDLEAAADMLAGWIAREPGNARALAWQAEACGRLGLLERAVDAAQAAARAAPDRADVQTTCGQLLVDRNRAAEARPHFERALAVSPGDPVATLGLARCLHLLGDAPGAVRLLDGLLAANPNDVAVLNVRGMVALQSGQPADAVRFFRRAEERSPADLDALNGLAQATNLLGRADEAKRYRERYEAGERDLKELTEITRAVAHDPRNPDLRFKAGELLLRNGFTDGGVRWLQSALAENPAHEPSRKALAAARRPR
jgi:tetratricopeptide (TPR) repeat protein